MTNRTDAELIEEFSQNINNPEVRRNALKKLYRTAQIFEKRICDLTYDEIKTALHKAAISRYHTLYNIFQIGSQFTDWCIMKGESVTNINYFALITEKDIRACLMQDGHDLLSWDDVLSRSQKLISHMTKFIVLASFEGITMTDICDMKMSDIDAEGNQILLKRGVLSVHPEVITEAKFAHDENMATTWNTSKGTKICIGEENLIACLAPTDSSDLNRSKKLYLQNHLSRLLKGKNYYGGETTLAYYSATYITNCGLVWYTDKLKGNLSMEEFLNRRTKENEEIFYRYSYKTPSRVRSIYYATKNED